MRAFTALIVPYEGVSRNALHPLHSMESSVLEYLWMQSVNVLVFPSPTGYVLIFFAVFFIKSEYIL